MTRGVDRSDVVDTKRDVGIAVSGGGHRATVFGLGALLAVVDVGLSQKVTSISSVSGGSIANGVVMSGPDFGTVDTAEFEGHVKRCLTAIATRGVLLGGAPATTGYLRALVASLVVAVFGIIGVPLFATLDLWAAMAISAIVGVVFVLVTWWLFRQRSVRVQRAIDGEMLAGDQISLAQVRSRRSSVHHVICTTEIQTGKSFYFSNRMVYGYQFGPSILDVDLPLAEVVQASACVPGAFNPREIALSDLGVHAPTNREGKQDDKISSIVLVDGGVYDNMADQWEYDFPGRLVTWPKLADVQPERGSHLIVVNGSGGWVDPKPIGRSGLATEIAGLLRAKDVQYNVSTARRRQALYDRFTEIADGEPDDMRGDFVQITDSPYRIVNIFRSDAMQSKFPDRAKRAQAAFEFLGAQGYTPEWWAKVVARTSRVPTTLAKLGIDCTAELLEQGYVLTMVNTYVVSGRGALREIDRARFRSLSGGAPSSGVT